MKVLLSEVLNMSSIFSMLGKERDLDISTKWKIREVNTVLQPKAQELETMRQELVFKYGESNEAKNETIVRPENLADFQKEFLTLINEETEVPDVKFKLQDFNKSTINSDELELIKKFIVTDEKV